MAGHSPGPVASGTVEPGQELTRRAAVTWPDDQLRRAAPETVETLTAGCLPYPANRDSHGVTRHETAGRVSAHGATSRDRATGDYPDTAPNQYRTDTNRLTEPKG